jgi:hypothetical protein
MNVFRTVLTGIAVSSIVGLATAAHAGPGTATGIHDGHYKGLETLVRDQSPKCTAGSGGEKIRQIVVKNDTIYWKTGVAAPWDTKTVPVRVQPDGSFKGQFGFEFLSGRINGNEMSGWTGSSACGWSLRLRKLGSTAG